MSLFRLSSKHIYYVFFIALLFHSSKCWNELVHEAIALTAMSHIKEKNLTKLLTALHGSDLVDYANWGHAVEEMIPQSSRVFTQPQFDKTCSDVSTDCDNNEGLCLLNGIKYFYHKLLPDELEAPRFKYPKNINFTDMDSIKYLVALIAELHNPMRFGFRSDDFGKGVGLSVEATPFFIVSPTDLNSGVETIHEPPVDKTLNDLIESYLIEVFVKKHEDFWYGGWTHVNTLGIKFHEELDMFKNSLHNAFDMWAQESFSLLCEIYNFIIAASDNPKIKPGTPFSATLTPTVQTQILQILKKQILLAGGRIAIVLNHILSIKEIDYTRISINVPQFDNKPHEHTASFIKTSYFSGFLTNLSIFIVICSLFYAALKIKTIKRFLFKPTLV